MISEQMDSTGQRDVRSHSRTLANQSENLKPQVREHYGGCQSAAEYHSNINCILRDSRLL